MIPYFTTEGKEFTITVMEVTTKDRKLVVPHRSLKKFVQKAHLKSIGQKDYYDFDEAKKYYEQNILLTHYQNYLDNLSEVSIIISEIKDELYKNYDFIEVNGNQFIRLNYTDKWLDNLESRSIDNKNILYKKWGNYYISHEGIDLLEEADLTGLLVPF